MSQVQLAPFSVEPVSGGLVLGWVSWCPVGVEGSAVLGRSEFSWWVVVSGRR